MKKLLCLTLCLLLALGAAGCAEKTYAPTGQLSGDEALDGQVLALLEKLCSPKETAQENLLHVYDFLCNDITYRPGTADTSGGFTAELTAQGYKCVVCWSGDDAIDVIKEYLGI